MIQDIGKRECGRREESREKSGLRDKRYGWEVFKWKSKTQRKRDILGEIAASKAVSFFYFLYHEKQ